ncbi:MAG: hypothetical protein AAF557_27700, partial [Pseudomonadota bacterium]
MINITGWFWQVVGLPVRVFGAACGVVVRTGFEFPLTPFAAPLGWHEDVMRDTGTEVEYVSIDSVNGHDAFLIDDEHFTP